MNSQFVVYVKTCYFGNNDFWVLGPFSDREEAQKWVDKEVLPAKHDGLCDEYGIKVIDEPFVFESATRAAMK
jgi:hypothetical protein